MHKTIYVVGGTNGVVKSTIREEYDFLNSLQAKNPLSIKDFSSIDEVRKLYETTRKKSD